MEKVILQLKQDHPGWDAPKIREKLLRQYPGIKPPANSTIHAVLDRQGLVKRRKRRRHRAQGTPLAEARAPNALWCADFKGQFPLGNRQYCYPLTLSDYHARYLLACEALDSTRETGAFPVFERAFRDFGLPAAIRTDNGVPFASAHALFGLTRLSVWWLRLGIAIERIQPGKPQQNGRHERLRLTLKQETTQPPAAPEYPFHDRTLRVTRRGRLCIGQRKVNLSGVFAGQTVGIREVADRIWLVSFMDYDLGFFDENDDRVEPVGHNPFTTTVLPMSSE